MKKNKQIYKFMSVKELREERLEVLLEIPEDIEDRLKLIDKYLRRFYKT